jgi:hypothetical protein
LLREPGKGEIDCMPYIDDRASERNDFPQHRDPLAQRAEHALASSTGVVSCLRAGADTAHSDTDWSGVRAGVRSLMAVASIDWKAVAQAAWEAPGWREAALEYHRTRPASPKISPRASEKLLASEREIWRAAGQCIRRKAAHDALRTFLGWCDRHGVSQGDALPIFKTIVDKELAK